MNDHNKNLTSNNYQPAISKPEQLEKSHVSPLKPTHQTTENPSRKLGFGISTIMGTTIPNGKIKSSFNEGFNVGIRLDTPVSFNLIGMENKLGVEIYMSSMDASSTNENNFDYYLTNLVGNFSVLPFNRMNRKKFYTSH